MNAYIDFNNFCSYLSSMNNQDFKQCNEILLGCFNLRFTFDRKEMQKTKKEIRRNFELWNKMATRNRHGHNNDWSVQFPPRPIHKNIHIDENFSNEDLSSLYMLSDLNEKDNVKEWAESGCFLVGTVGKELELLKKLKIGDSFTPTKVFRIKSMLSWDTFGENSTPCTDIIIVDPYIFAQSDLEYEHNSYALLQQLSKWANETNINIVIFTNSQYKDEDVKRNVPFTTINRNLKEKIKEITGKEPNVTFVILKPKEEHDRTILTNYRMYVSGDSYKYFEKKDEKTSRRTKGRWMFVCSLHDNDNYQDAKEFISDLQNIIDNNKTSLNGIRGDRKSLFLKFE